MLFLPEHRRCAHDLVDDLVQHAQRLVVSHDHQTGMIFHFAIL